AQVIARSAESLEARLELAARVVESAHHGAFRAVEHLADLRVGEPFHFAEEYDRSMIGGQLFHRGAQPARDLGVARAVEGLVGVERRGKGGHLAALVRLERHLRLLALPALMVDAEVEGDPVHPRVEPRVALEAVEVLVRLRERLLHDVERVVAAAEHPERQRRDLALIALDQRPEGLPAAAPGTLDELPVAIAHGLLSGETRVGAPY